MFLFKKKTIISSLSLQNAGVKPEMKESNILIVLGNGFNLGLGLRTSYSDFASKYLVRDSYDGESELSKALVSSYNESPKNWCDMEGEIKKFALSCRDTQLNFVKEREFFDTLVKDIGFYMDGEAKYQFLCQHLENNHSFNECLPVNMFKVIFSKNLRYHCISFNYTDMFLFLPEVAKDYLFLENVKEEDERDRVIFEYIKDRVDINYVHLTNNKCVLGIDDDERIPHEMDFLKKSYQFIRSPQYPEQMNEYKSIIVFGLSMGETDSDFIHILLDGVMSNTIEQNPHFFFITKSPNDQYTILTNITRHLKTNLASQQRHLSYDFIFDDSLNSKSELSYALMPR